MMNRSRLYLLPFCLCLTAVVFAQEESKKENKPAATKEAVRDAKALEIVKFADTAIKKVKFVQYKSKVESTGGAAAFAPPAEGVVTAMADPSGGSKKYRIRVKAKRPNSEEVLEFTVGGDGEEFYLIDPSAKKVYVDIDPAVAGNRGRIALGLTMREYLHERPFGDELEADTVELKGAEKIGDQNCDVVRVVYKGGQGESIWYFSNRDHLPRRRTMVFNNPMLGGEATFTITLTDLVVEPQSGDDPFKLVVPDGFEKIEDFAPEIPMPRPS